MTRIGMMIAAGLLLFALNDRWLLPGAGWTEAKPEQNAVGFIEAWAYPHAVGNKIVWRFEFRGIVRFY